MSIPIYSTSIQVHTVHLIILQLVRLASASYSRVTRPMESRLPCPGRGDAVLLCRCGLAAVPAFPRPGVPLSINPQSVIRETVIVSGVPRSAVP